MQQKRNGLPARHELKYFIHPTELEALRSLTPLERRSTEQFHTFFHTIWKELDIHA